MARLIGLNMERKAAPPLDNCQGSVSRRFDASALLQDLASLRWASSTLTRISFHGPASTAPGSPWPVP